MMESMKFFEIILNQFTKPTIILLFNKRDIFDEKIMKHDLKDFFPNYDGPKQDPLAAREFIKEMYSSLNKDPNRIIETHFINATGIFLCIKIFN